MGRIRNTLRYIALSYKINFTGGAASCLDGLTDSSVRARNNQFQSVFRTYRQLCRTDCRHGSHKLLFMSDIRHCRPWSVQSADKNKIYRLRPVCQRVRPEKCRSNTVKRVSELEQISFDSSSRFSQIKDASENRAFTLEPELADDNNSVLAHNNRRLRRDNFGLQLLYSSYRRAFGGSYHNYRHTPVRVDVESQKKLSKDDHTVGYYDKLFSDSAYAKELKLFSAYEKFIDRWCEALFWAL